MFSIFLQLFLDKNQSSIVKDMKQDAYEQNSKVQKKVTKWMKVPEKVICIAYINNYPLLKPKFLNKKTKAARKIAIEKRELDCVKYYDAAYYDKKRRKENIADATVKVLDENAKAKQQKAETINKRRPTNCTERKSGSRIIINCN